MLNGQNIRKNLILDGFSSIVVQFFPDNYNRPIRRVLRSADMNFNNELNESHSAGEGYKCNIVDSLFRERYQVVLEETVRMVTQKTRNVVCK